MATVKTADKVKRKEVFLITHTQHFWSFYGVHTEVLTYLCTYDTHLYLLLC